MRDIGVDVKVPTGDWDGDENCPFYGSLRLKDKFWKVSYLALECKRASPSKETT